MKIRGITDYDIVNYKEPTLFIAFPYCNFKCDREYGSLICQNSALAREPIIDTTISRVIDIYLNNPLTKGMVCGGLEPFDSANDLVELIEEFRKISDDPVIIYTGYTEKELTKEVLALQKYPNIIIKFGRFIPNRPHRFDDVLGIKLASDNQYALLISKDKRFQYIPNPDKEHYQKITDAIKANNGYCCCKLEQTPDTKCICKEFQEQTTVGPCHCGRFIKIEVQTGEKGEK